MGKQDDIDRDFNERRLRGHDDYPQNGGGSGCLKTVAIIVIIILIVAAIYIGSGGDLNLKDLFGH